MNEIEQGIRDLIVQLNAARAENERLRAVLDLRGVGPAERYWEGRWRDEAAENETLRVALKPFAEADQYYDSSSGDNYSPSWAEFFTIGDFRRARAALAQKERDE